MGFLVSSFSSSDDLNKCGPDADGESLDSRCDMTKRRATSGLQSPSEIWRKTLSGNAFPRALEKETSVVRKMI